MIEVSDQLIMHDGIDRSLQDDILMIGLLGYVIDTEQANTLSLKSHNRIKFLISWVLDGRRTILC